MKDRVFDLTVSILDSISDGVFTVDRDWRILSFNRAAVEITGVPPDQAIGRKCHDVFRSSLCGERCALRKTLESGEPASGISAFIIDASGQRVPVSLSTAVLRDENGRFIGGVETFRDLSEIEALRTELKGMNSVGDLESRSPLMHRIFEILPAVAGSSSNVLIQGETGTGKEVLARTIHNLGPRADHPFVAVNCGALPESLLESELFGYVQGAFTGAVGNRQGRFAVAGRGTLFIDEISEIPPSVQVKLLRVLQERTYEPLGSSRQKLTEARIIAASNRDLKKLVSQGRFREDLYYRVNVVRLDLPPLRSRREDIPLLVSEFIRRFNTIQGKQVPGIEPQALSILMGHDWPGNVRELENVIERAFVICDGSAIAPYHLPMEFSGLDNEQSVKTSGGGDLRQARRNHDARIIEQTLKKHDNCRVATAAELGIHKTTLYRRMKKLGLLSPGDRS